MKRGNDKAKKLVPAALGERTISPPQPNWKCNNCGKKLYLKGADEAPKKCPQCGSTNVRSWHLRVLK